MSHNYSRSLLRISVAQICQNLGWNSAQSSSLEVLTDVLERYLSQLGGICHRYSEQFGRTQPNLDDLGLAFKHMGINISELEDYVKHVDPVPFAHDVVAFPAKKPSNLGFPNSRSREILHQREEHVHDHLPYMYPNMTDEVPIDKPKSPIVEVDDKGAFKSEPGLEETSQSTEVVGEKRSSTISATEGPPPKRQRIGNSCLLEEASHSQYEMKCVYMGPNGVITTRPGCQGRKPQPGFPPPNPRNINENNKENKLKEAANGTKGSNTVGGIGVDGLSSKKTSKKSFLKKGLHIHDKASKVAIEMMSKELGKKSASSKAAAKFIKKLKSSKKSAKVFGKSKSKNKDGSIHEEGSSKENLTVGVSTDKATKKKKKEKKSTAILDSDEELRNLSSPSRKEPSPERSAILSGEDRERRKARMDAIDDSINAVLRGGINDVGKGKKKRKKDVKKEETCDKNDDIKKGDEKSKDKAKKQKGNKQNRKNKDKKPDPAAVDIKPFVSEKYSSEELQVYEFNDSPPDANSIQSRRPSAPDMNSPPHPASHSAPPKQTSSTSHFHGHHKTVKHIEPEEELFAPEIKIESRSDLIVKPLKLDLNKEKDKEKNRAKDGKKEKTGDDKHKSKDNKIDKSKDKKEKHKVDEKLKDKHKDKEIKKDKKDKKKDKEKKKKHKEKDRDREKDKEKKRDEKIKQEARESRESSPAMGIGVKLKIKIGGSTGPTSSMMVTGEGSSPDRASPAPSVSSKRDSMSPPKVPRLFISKKGQEEKSKKSSKHSSKGKASPVAISVKSRSSSPAGKVPSPANSRDRTPPSKNPSPTPSRKTPTPPPPPPSASHSLQPQRRLAKESAESSSKLSKTVKDKNVRLSRKDKSKKKEPKSASVSPVPSKSGTKQRQTPPRLSRVSSSPENSPPPLPAESPSARPRTHSPSPASSRHSPTPPPSLSRHKITPPPPLSPATSRTGSGSTPRKQAPRASSPSPSKPPTPGSTSPAASPEWNYPESPSHQPSPTPPPRTPTGSPRHAPSPGHSSLPRTPNADRSPSPALPHSPPAALRIDTPEAISAKEYPSPASSSKSSASAAKNRTVEAETVCVFIDDSGQKVWICPTCKLQDDGSEMIGCDSCDNWYHWVCVNITQAPPEEQQWFCETCLVKNKSATKSTRGRGRPRGRGRGRGRKKIS